MRKPTKEEWAAVAREYPTMGHAYVAEKDRREKAEAVYYDAVSALDSLTAALERSEHLTSAARSVAIKYEARAQKAEAVVEAARRAMKAPPGEDFDELEAALTAHDEPPTPKATIDDLFIPVKPPHDTPTEQA